MQKGRSVRSFSLFTFDPTSYLLTYLLTPCAFTYALRLTPLLEPCALRLAPLLLRHLRLVPELNGRVIHVSLTAAASAVNPGTAGAAATTTA